MTQHEDEKERSDIAGERRVDERHLACFPAYLERTEGGKHTSMIRNLSVSGALLLTQGPLPIGEPVRLELFIYKDLTQFHTAMGKAIRVERLSLDRVGVWSHRIGIQFDQPLTEVEEAIKRLADQQADLGGNR